MNITLQDLLDAGVHFGHQLRRFNPKSKKFVFDHRHGVSIIDLEKTFAQLQASSQFIEDLVANGKDILLIGTKKQAQEIVRDAAANTRMPFAAGRWLGGLLTNFVTIKNSITKYKRYQKMEADGSMAKLPKKEQAAIKREMNRMQRNFEGIVDMNGMPGAVFIIDISHDDIAAKEAARLGLPVVALVDTNSDPTLVDYPIPGNDDSAKSIRLITDVIVQAIQNGMAQREARQATRKLNPDLVREDAAAAAALANAQREDGNRRPGGDRPRRGPGGPGGQGGGYRGGQGGGQGGGYRGGQGGGGRGPGGPGGPGGPRRRKDDAAPAAATAEAPKADVPSSFSSED